MKFFLVIALAIFLSACAYDPGDKRLQITNKTDHKISYEYGADTIPYTNNLIEYYLSTVIYPDESMSIPENDADWPGFLKRSQNGKVYFFIYRLDSLKKYNDIHVANHNKIYKRLEYSLEDLEKMNWEITIE